MASIKIICPDCEKVMNAPSHVKGKKIRCKACGSTFVARESGTVAAEKRPAKRPAKAPAKGPSKSPKKGKKGSPTAKGTEDRERDPIMDMQLDLEDDELEDLPTLDEDDDDELEDLPTLDDEKDKPDSDEGELKEETFGLANDDDDEDDDGNPYGMTETDLSARCPHCANPMEDEDAVICLHCGYNTQTRQIGQTKKTYDITGMDYFLWWLPGIACVLGIIFLATLDIVWCTQSHMWFDPEEWLYYLSHFAVKLWLVIFSLFGMFYMGKFAFKRLVLDNQPAEIEKK